MAAAGLPPVCYNHPEKRADFKCFDCKFESIINLCPQCNIQVHSLDVFRAHKVESLEQKGKERRLSQDVSDIEKLIEVESDLLQSVLTKLKYTQQEEKETLSQLIQLQTATKKRVAEIKDCEAKIEKAFNYLAKVSSMLTQCSAPVEGSGGEAFKDPPVEATVEQSQDSVLGSSEQPSVNPTQELPDEDQKCPPEAPPINFPEQLKGKDIFPVCVIGSLARNGSFWIVKIGEPEMDKQRQIQTVIRNHFHKHGFGNPVVVEEGAFCAALHRQYKEFCRARIELVTASGMVRLRFLDLGTVEDVQPSSLCELPLDVLDISFQALECCLLPDLETQLPYEAKWCFKDLTFNKILMAAVEGQVTDKKGHVAQHVTLGSCGEVAVCINNKVAKLVEEQRQALEDRPVQMKVEKAETEKVVVEEDTCEAQTLETATPNNLAQETDPKMDTMTITSEEEKATSKTDTEISVPDAIVTSNDKAAVSAENSDDASDDKPMLRADAAEFVPVSPESDSPPQDDKIPVHSALEQSSVAVPGILHLPVQNKPVSTMPAIERYNNAVPETHLPVGCVDFATYNRILTKCSLNLVCNEDLSRARFVMIRSEVKRIVEAMKFNVWCSSIASNRRLNRIFHEAANDERSPVFLLFSRFKSYAFCGMAEMVSAVDPKKSCPMLNDPFRFGTKMVGRSDIKWIFASNLYYGDVLTPEYPRRYLVDAGDGFEIANKLGQTIIKTFDSSGYFQSVLQQAMEAYKNHLVNQLENEESNDAEAEPLWTPPEEPSNELPTSQEDWDQEIEEKLKAAKSSEFDQVDVSSVQEAPKDNPSEKEETDSSAVPEVDVRVSVEGPSLPVDTSRLTSDGPVHSVESSKDIVLGDGDSATACSVEEAVTKVVDTYHQDVTVVNAELQQDYDHQEIAIDEDKGISTEMSDPVAMEIQSTAEAVSVPSSQEIQAEGSAPEDSQEDVHEDGGMEPTCESDWETGSPTKSSFNEVTVDVETNSDSESTTKWNDAVSEFEKYDKSPTDTQQTFSSEDSSSTVEVQKTASEDAAPVSTVPQNQNDFHDSTDETVHAANTTQDDDELVPHACNSLGVDAIEDDPSGGGFPPDPCLAENVDDENKVVVNDTGASVSYIPVVKEVIDVGQVNGELGAKYDPVSASLHLQEVLSHGSSEELLSDYDEMPVEIGKEHWIIPQESLTSGGTFWAHVVRTSKEEVCFVDAMKRMGAHIEAQNKPLDPSDIHIYKHCAVKGWDGYWYRALVEKTLEGKGKIFIRMLDLGESWEVHQKDLRVLDDEFYAAPPAQAFECSICYENPNSRKEKSRIPKLVRKNRKLRVLVKSFSPEGTVGVQVLP